MEAVVCESLLMLVMRILGLHIDLDQLEDEATPQFTPVATTESSLLSLVTPLY